MSLCNVTPAVDAAAADDGRTASVFRGPSGRGALGEAPLNASWTDQFSSLLFFANLPRSRVSSFFFQLLLHM